MFLTTPVDCVGDEEEGGGWGELVSVALGRTERWAKGRTEPDVGDGVEDEVVGARFGEDGQDGALLVEDGAEKDRVSEGSEEVTEATHSKTRASMVRTPNANAM